MQEKPTKIIFLDYEPKEYEYLGSKEKFWFYDKERKQNGLFKIGRHNTGENWTEYVSSQLAKLINLPAVDYQLAIWKEKTGTVCYSMNGENQLLLGNIILSAYSAYPNHHTTTRFLKVPEYTLQLVLECNSHSKLQLPIGYKADSEISKALHIFIGYLLFDTWIGNTDRHHENWAWILHNTENTFHLAPSFDHASSLGRELTDALKANKMKTKDLGQNIFTYSKKARTPFFGDARQSKPLTTHEIAEILFLQFHDAVKNWVLKIQDVSDKQIDDIIASVPSKPISDISIDFVKQLLYLNKSFLSDLMLGKS